MKKLIATALILALIFTACGKEPTHSTASNTTAPEPMVAMGRYIEQDITPEFWQNREVHYVGWNDISVGADNTLYCFNHDTRPELASYKDGEWATPINTDHTYFLNVTKKYLNAEEFYIYTVKNGVSEVKKISPLGEALGPNGEIFSPVVHAEFLSNATTGAEVKSENSNFTKTYYLMYNESSVQEYALEGSKREILPEINKNLSLNFKQSRITSAYELIVPKENSIQFYSLKDNKTVLLGEVPLTSEKRQRLLIVPAAVIGTNAFVAHEDFCEIINLQSGESIATINLKNVQAVCEGVNDEFYAANKDGIWRITNGGISERIIDGAMSAFSSPSKNINAMRLSQDGTIYVQTSNYAAKQTQLGMRLYKYSFSPSTKTERDKTLHIWTLRESQTIIEAAAEFMRYMPDTKLYIECASNYADKLTESEAIALLYKNIEDGKGPDIIITDGINIKDLYSKGAIKELSTNIIPENYENRFLPIGKINKKQMVISARLKLPIVYNIAGYGDLSGLVKLSEQAKAIANNETVFILSRHNDKTQSECQSELLNTAYCASAGEIWNNGELSLEKLEVFLEFCKRLNDSLIAHINSETKNVTISEGEYQNKNIYTVHLLESPALALGYSYLGLEEKMGAVLNCNIAIGKNALNEEAATKFIACVLSPNIQNLLVGEGAGVIKQKIYLNENVPRENPELSILESINVFNDKNNIQAIALEPLAYMPIYKNDEFVLQLTQEYTSGNITLIKALETARTYAFS